MALCPIGELRHEPLDVTINHYITKLHNITSFKYLTHSRKQIQFKQFKLTKHNNIDQQK